jgi:hypothetical protein
LRSDLALGAPVLTAFMLWSMIKLMSTEAIPARIFFAQATCEVADWGNDPGYWEHMIDVAQQNAQPLAVEVYRAARVLSEDIDRLTEDDVPISELEDAYAVEALIYGGAA